MNVEQFVAELNIRFGDDKHSYGSDPPGPKFTRVTVTNWGQRSVYCFVDEDGNVYKSAGWKKPASGIRANLNTLDWSKVDQGTRWLYR